MRIRRLRIEGFGNLRGEYIFAHDRCNLILEPNESGKSTLAAAIAAALYGLPRQRASRERTTLKDRFRPWDGDRYALEIEVERGDAAWLVRRDFDRDTATVHEGLSGRDVTDQFSTSREQLQFGEKLTGLSREDFVRCCFVGQGELGSVREASGLTHAMQKAASSQRGDIAAGEAIDILRRATEQEYRGMRLGKGKVASEIKRLEKEIDEVRAEAEAIAARRRDSEEKVRALEGATAREGRAEDELRRLDYLQLAAARDEARVALDRARRQEAAIAALKAERASLIPFAEFPAQQAGRLRELKGKIESLRSQRETAAERLQADVRVPLDLARARLAAGPDLSALSSAEIAQVADRQAVLAELWAQRREKRAALRAEEKRLRIAGIDPGRSRRIGAQFSSLSPADRAFLSGYREASLDMKEALAEAERTRDRLLQESAPPPLLGSISPAPRGEGLALAAGFFGIVLAAVLWFSLEGKIPALLMLLVSGAGFLAWIRLQERRPVPGAEQFGTELQRVQTEIWAREKDLAALRERLSGLASQLGHASAERMMEDFRELESLQEKAGPLAALAAGHTEIVSRYRSAAEELRGIMSRAGVNPGQRPITPRVARRFRAQLDHDAEIRARISRLASVHEAGTDELAAIGIELETFVTTFETIAAEAMRSMGSPLAGGSADLESTLDRFADASARRERLERIDSELLPALERSLAATPGSTLEGLVHEVEVLDREIEARLASHPDLGGLTPERSSREYVEMRRRLQEEVRSTQRVRLALAEELGDVLKEYRGGYHARLTTLASLEQALSRASAFRESITMAIEALSSLSREAYSEWAEVLNEKASVVLRRLTPHYEDLRFDTDLSFTLRDSRTGARRDQAAVEAAFSAGARDQIYLAIRMAISEYLSGPGLRLPLILDDPFASFDDTRFQRAMEFLLESVAKRHQIIAFSCHLTRHERWRASTAPSISDRVRTLDLTPLSI